MTEQTSGLRFDIYERVHLVDEQPAMKSIESIELVPLIQVTAEGEHAQLRGNLLLTGLYFSELDNETRTLEHWIPVEITLPLNRVQRLEDIAVEIENFDIDLLSSRMLNVTGVLSLRGFDALPVARDWQDVQQLSNQEYPDDRVKAKPVSPPLPEEPKADTYVGFESVSGDGTWLESVDTVSEQESVWVDEPSLGVPSAPVIFENIMTPTEAEMLPVPATPIMEDKKELKVGFGSKPSAAQNHLQNIKNLMQDSDGKTPGKYYRDQEVAGEAGREGIRGDELEWQKLFLGNRSSERSFQKVKLCIVQKEETMDGIAERYSINPREIMQFNGLNNYQIAAGQVIYIPS